MKFFWRGWEVLALKSVLAERLLGGGRTRFMLPVEGDREVTVFTRRILIYRALGGLVTGHWEKGLWEVAEP